MKLPRLNDILGPPTPRGRKICYYGGMALLCWMNFSIAIAVYWKLWYVVGMKAIISLTVIYQLNKMKNYYNSNGGKW